MIASIQQSHPLTRTVSPLLFLQPHPGPETIWRMVLAELRQQMTVLTFNNWLAGSMALTPACTPTLLVVLVRTIYAWEWLTHPLLPMVSRTVRTVVGEQMLVCFVPRTIRAVAAPGTAVPLPTPPTLTGPPNPVEMILWSDAPIHRRWRPLCATDPDAA